VDTNRHQFVIIIFYWRESPLLLYFVGINCPVGRLIELYYINIIFIVLFIIRVLFQVLVSVPVKLLLLLGSSWPTEHRQLCELFYTIIFIPILF